MVNNKGSTYALHLEFYNQDADGRNRTGTIIQLVTVASEIMNDGWIEPAVVAPSSAAYIDDAPALYPPTIDTRGS